MSDLGLAGTDSPDPVTFIVTLGGFVPTAFTILSSFCILAGFLMFVFAGSRQISTAHGRGDTTSMQNLMHACFGAALAVTAELIGGFGKGIFGDFQSASVLLYVAKDQNSMARTSLLAFMSVVQFIGACSVVFSIRVADRLATGKPYPGETWTSVFWFSFGGLLCVFVQQTLGLLSAITGLNIARFINTL